MTILISITFPIVAYRKPLEKRSSNNYSDHSYEHLHEHSYQRDASFNLA